MGSVNFEDNEWFDDLEDSLEDTSHERSEKVTSHMETLDRKKVRRDAISRSPQVRQRPKGSMESMMKCVITDSTLEHGVRNYQVALTPRTERRYQSPLLSGRRVISQIPRAAVSNSPLHSPRRARGGHERVRVYASPEINRSAQHSQGILQSKVVPSKEQNSNVISTQPSNKEVIVMKGLLWVQQDKLFCRWKEKFIVLTSHYLQFFKKTSSRISEMGAFIMKVRLIELSSVTLEDRRGYLTLVVSFQQEGRLVLRKSEGIRQWHDCLETLLTKSKDDTEERKMESTEQFWDRKVKDDTIVIPYYCMNLPRSSALLKESSTPNYSSTKNFVLSPHLCRNTDEDSGLESMKTNTSDSGSSSLHARTSAILSDDENTKVHHNFVLDDEDAVIYDKFDKVRNVPEKTRKKKEKHERGVTMAEYSKFRAKLPFITP